MLLENAKYRDCHDTETNIVHAQPGMLLFIKVKLSTTRAFISWYSLHIQIRLALNCLGFLSSFCIKCECLPYILLNYV